MDQFSARVRELRKKMGWAQEDLARQIDVSLSTVQRWEGKGAKPTRASPAKSLRGSSKRQELRRARALTRCST